MRFTLIIMSITNLSLLKYIMITSIVMISQYTYISTCPRDEISWQQREIVLSCKSSEYHCGISIHGKEVEFCATPLFVRKGLCPLFYYSDDLNVYAQNCTGDGCPLTGYLSNELFKYLSCLNNSLENNKIPISPTGKTDIKKYMITENHTSISTNEHYSIPSKNFEDRTLIPMQVNSNAHSILDIKDNDDISTYLLKICGVAEFLVMLINFGVFGYAIRIKRKMQCNDETRMENDYQIHAIDMEEFEDDCHYEEVGVVKEAHEY